MTDMIFYVLAVLTLPVGAIIIAHYVGWTLERDLAKSHRNRLEMRRKAAASQS